MNFRHAGKWILLLLNRIMHISFFYTGRDFFYPAVNIVFPQIAHSAVITHFGYIQGRNHFGLFLAMSD